MKEFALVGEGLMVEATLYACTGAGGCCLSLGRSHGGSLKSW